MFINIFKIHLLLGDIQNSADILPPVFIPCWSVLLAQRSSRDDLKSDK